MASVTQERRGEIQREVLRVLQENPDGIQAKNVIKAVAERLVLSTHESSDYPNAPGVRRFDKILRFSTIGPVKAGWIIKEKGIWKITDLGEQALRDIRDSAGFDKESGRLYREWKMNQSDDVDVDEEETSSSTTLEEAEESAWQEICDFLSEIHPYKFQELVAGLLKAMGYHISWNAPPGPDKGIDIVAHKDALGVEGPRIKVQVKRMPSTKVTAESLRAFMSTLGENDVGLFVASGGFTRDAAKEAREQEKRRITLWDLQDLFDLWVKYYKSIPDEQRSLLPLRFVPFLDPEN